MKRTNAAAMALFGCFIACNSPEAPDMLGQSGTLVALRIQARALSSSTYKLTVTAAGMDTIGPTLYAGGQYIELYVPQGTGRYFHLEHYDSSGLLIDSGTTVADIGAGMNTVSATLAPLFSVTYDGNGNTSGNVPVSANNYVQGTTVTVLGNLNNLVKTGYTFIGWNTASDGTGTDYAAGGTFTIDTADVTLYAQWTANPTYTVTYDGNGSTGGSIPAAAGSYEEGDTVTVLGNINSLMKSGYSFGGWNTAANGSGTSYSPGDTFSMDTVNVTLYAQWVINQYTVTFNSNGGTSVTSQAVNYNATATAPSPAPAKAGYTFSGWYSDAVLTAAFSFSTPITADKTLYAKWTLNAPVITVHPQSTSAIEGQTASFSVTATGDSLHYQWQKNSANISGATSATYTTPVTAFADNGSTYRCIVSNSAGAENSSAATLTVTLQRMGTMVKICAAGKTYMMGEGVFVSPSEVTFTYDLWIDTTEVTQKAYAALMAATYAGYVSPSWLSGAGDNFPVYNVNWYDAALYCNALTKNAGSTDTVYSYTSVTGTRGNDCVLNGLSIDMSKTGYRLPTDAEWEFACRAGRTTAYYWGNEASDDSASRYAWYAYNSGDMHHVVANKLPNAYSLYDMGGNVGEMCNDWYEYFEGRTMTDPTGPATGTNRVHRGSWYASNLIDSFMMMGERGNIPPDYEGIGIGFRCVRPLP